MKFISVPDVVEFSKIINQCKSAVYLTSNTMDDSGNYDLSINLKSGLSLYLGIAELIKDEHENLEIHCNSYEDEVIIMDFLNNYRKPEIMQDNKMEVDG